VALMAATSALFASSIAVFEASDSFVIFYKASVEASCISLKAAVAVLATS